MIRRFKDLADRRTNHAEDEFEGSAVDGNVASATASLKETNLSSAKDEQQQ